MEPAYYEASFENGGRWSLGLTRPEILRFPTVRPSNSIPIATSLGGLIHWTASHTEVYEPISSTTTVRHSGPYTKRTQTTFISCVFETLLLYSYHIYILDRGPRKPESLAEERKGEEETDEHTHRDIDISKNRKHELFLTQDSAQQVCGMF